MLSYKSYNHMWIYIHLALKMSSAQMSMQKISNNDFQTSTDAINKILDGNGVTNKATDTFDSKQTEFIANEAAGPGVFKDSTSQNTPKINNLSTKSFQEQKMATTFHPSSYVPTKLNDDTNHGVERAFVYRKIASMKLDVVEINILNTKTPLDTTLGDLPADPEMQTQSATSSLKSTIRNETSRKSSTMKNYISMMTNGALIPPKPAFPSIGNTLSI